MEKEVEGIFRSSPIIFSINQLFNVENKTLFHSETDLTVLGPKIYINFHTVYVNENLHI